MKKVLASLVMIMLSLSAWASYDGEIWQDKTSGLVYELDDDNSKVRVYQYFGGAAVTIPEVIKIYNINYTVDEIGEKAFYNKSQLTSVTIQGNKLTKIGKYAFGYCTNLVSITLPSSVYSIGASAFESCSSLKSIVLPESLTGLEANLFSACTSLESLTLPSNITYINSRAITLCHSLKSLVIPNSVTRLAASCISSNAKLENVTLPNKLTDIPESFLSNCEALKNVSFPSTLRTIGKNAFVSCGFERVMLPDGITEIKDGAFQQNENLSTATIPRDIKTLGNVYTYCGKLRRLYCHAPAPVMPGEYAFSPGAYFADAVLLVPQGKVNDYKTASRWSSFKNIREEIKGDADADGKVDVSDVNEIINLILNQGKLVSLIGADVNGDGKVDVADVNDIINLILNQ